MDTPVKRTISEADSSPEISQAKRTNTKIDPMEDTLKDIFSQLKQLSGLPEVCASTKSTVDSMCATLDNLTSKVNDLESRCSEAEKQTTICKQENVILKHKMKTLEDRVIKAEAYSRRDNLIFEGIPYADKEDPEAKLREFIKTKMKVTDADKIVFERVHRLPGNTRIIAKFHYYKDKERVWDARDTVKRIPYKVYNDFPTEIRNRRQVLSPILRAAYKQDMKAKFVMDRLVVNSQSYTVDTLHLLPESLRLSQTSLVTKDDKVFFYSRSAPFSNFFPARFELNGIKFSCSEQFYQWAKADLHGDAATADRILAASDPAEMKRLGGEVDLDPARWSEGVMKRIMETGLVEKFRQNRHLKEVLISTEQKMLVEASPQDRFWGVGVNMKNIMQMNPSQYPGQNELGKLLESIRSKLSTW